jgi:hypothetical protein
MLLFASPRSRPSPVIRGLIGGACTCRGSPYGQRANGRSGRAANALRQVEVQKLIMSLIAENAGARTGGGGVLVRARTAGPPPGGGGGAPITAPSAATRYNDIKSIWSHAGGTLLGAVMGGTSHIVFGTDLPYGTSAQMSQALRGVEFSGAELAGIERDNGLAVLPSYRDAVTPRE